MAKNAIQHSENALDKVSSGVLAMESALKSKILEVKTSDHSNQMDEMLKIRHQEDLRIT